MDCSFESASGVSSLCGFAINNATVNRWDLHSGKVPTADTGPSSDHTLSKYDFIKTLKKRNLYEWILHSTDSGVWLNISMFGKLAEIGNQYLKKEARSILKEDYKRISPKKTGKPGISLKSLRTR